MNYYKITNENELHHGMQYQDGLNTDVLPFNPTGDCEPGGIYFASTDIFSFLDYGPWIRKVIVPEGETIYENSGYPKKYKTHSVFLEPRRKIDLDVIKELIDEGANIHSKNNYALQWASERGHLDVVKFLIEKGANIHVDNNFSLRSASCHGHLDVVKFLVEKGANIHAYNDCALSFAIQSNHLEIVKFLKEKSTIFSKLKHYLLKIKYIFNAIR